VGYLRHLNERDSVPSASSVAAVFARNSALATAARMPAVKMTSIHIFDKKLQILGTV
jgi:hypothetical protein